MKKLLFILTIAISTTNVKAQCFSSATNFTASFSPFSVISADFNGDGDLDLATTSFSSNNSIAILLGDGSGNFGASTNFIVGSATNSIISLDFNGDGNMDLAITNQNSDNVSILLGNGLGSFSTATNFTVGINPRSVTSADFNGDGNMDLATANRNSDNVTVLEGNGIGGFSITNTSTVGTAPNSIISADFNGDGNMDLASCNANSSNVSVLLNTIPAYPDIINGSVTVCSGSTNSYSIAAVNGATSYTWTLPPGWTGTSSSTSITATANSTNGTILVTANSSCGSSAAQMISVAVNLVDTSVSQSGTSLTANATGFTYQWINCANMDTLSSETNQNFTATTNGNYAVIITTNGCADTSACYSIMSTGIENNLLETEIYIYPNPNNGIFSVKSETIISNIEIINMLGEKVYSSQINSEKQTLI